MSEKHDYDWEEVCLGGEFLEAVAKEYYKFLLADIGNRMCLGADEKGEIQSRFAPPEYDFKADPDGLARDLKEIYRPGESLSLESIQESLADISKTVTEYARTGMKLSASGARDLGKALAMHQTGRDIDGVNAKVRTIVKKRRKWQPYYDDSIPAISLI